MGIFAYFFSNHLMFHPPTSSYKDSENIIKLKTGRGDIISAVYLLNRNAKYTMLVSHGNAEDLGHMLPFLSELYSLGFSVFAYDYQGYGLSTGEPTEKGTYDAINAAYDYLTETLKIPPKQIVLFGNSIGAAVSIDLSSREPVGGVILQSPFVSAFRVLTQIPLWPFDKYNNLKKIKNINCPILIIHGRKDRVVPFWQGKKIYESANAPKEYLWIDGVGHNDIPWDSVIYKNAIKNFIEME
jgi:hypothetical protein